MQYLSYVGEVSIYLSESVVSRSVSMRLRIGICHNYNLWEGKYTESSDPSYVTL